MTSELLEAKDLMPSKLAATVVASSSAFFFTAPILIILRAEAEDGFGPHLIATAFASLLMWLSKRAIEAFSTRLTRHGVTQLTFSSRNLLRTSKRDVRWTDVTNAITDGRYIWIVSPYASLEIDPGVFWDAVDVYEYIARRLRPSGVAIARITRQ